MSELTPDEVKESLTGDQYKLYQPDLGAGSSPARWPTAVLGYRLRGYHRRATTCSRPSGFRVTFDGFTALYEEGHGRRRGEGRQPCRPLEQGDDPQAARADGRPAFHPAAPPGTPRPSLIKTLEENGIGRPSTYAPTITTILARGYVERERKALKPTPLGEVTTTAHDGAVPEHRRRELHRRHGEEAWTRWRAGKEDWVQHHRRVLRRASAKTLEQAEKNMEGKRIKVPDEETDDRSARSAAAPWSSRSGRYGKFLACSGLPRVHATPSRLVKDTGGICPKCGGHMRGAQEAPRAAQLLRLRATIPTATL